MPAPALTGTAPPVATADAAAPVKGSEGGAVVWWGWWLACVLWRCVVFGVAVSGALMLGALALGFGFTIVVLGLLGQLPL